MNTETLADPVLTSSDTLHCVTSDPKERAVADPRFLAVCDDTPVDVMRSVHCPPECGGHLVCGPCLVLSRETGLVQ